MENQMAEKKTVTEKLQKMNVPREVIIEKQELLEETLTNHKARIQEFRDAILQLEREANTMVGAISVCREFLTDKGE
jgi:hypothetical protein